LLVVILMNQIEQRFEVNIPVDLFFQYQTIHLIARHITDMLAARQTPATTKAVPEGFTRIRI
jgi:hypothetical protein